MREIIRFDTVADELYGADPGEFVSLREQRALQARRQGDRELAERIHRLRKPTTAAASVNRLARQRPGDVADLVALGDRLRQAHQDLDGDRLRALNHERSQLVRSLTQLAQALAPARSGESVAREIAATLRAAVAERESGARVQQGRLEVALAPSDVFGQAWLTSSPRPAAPKSSAKPKPARPSTSSEQVSREDEKETNGRQPGKDDQDRKHAVGRESARVAQQAQRRERERQRSERRAQARRARAEARKRLRAAEREEVRARERTEVARAALEAAEQAVRDSR